MTSDPIASKPYRLTVEDFFDSRAPGLDQSKDGKADSIEEHEPNPAEPATTSNYRNVLGWLFLLGLVVILVVLTQMVQKNPGNKTSGPQSTPNSISGSTSGTWLVALIGPRAAIGVICGGVVLGLVMIVVGWGRVLRKVHLKSADRAEITSFHLSDEGFFTTSASHEFSAIWDRYATFRETHRLFVLTLPTGRGDMIPKLAFEIRELARIRALLVKHVAVEPKPNT